MGAAAFAFIFIDDDFDFEEERDSFIRFAQRKELGPSTASLVAAAEERDIPYLRLNKYSLVQFGHGAYQQRIQATTTGKTGNIAVELAGDKEETSSILRDLGLPVPEQRLVRAQTDAVRAATGWNEWQGRTFISQEAWDEFVDAVAEREMVVRSVPRFERDEILKALCVQGIEAVVFDMDGTLIPLERTPNRLQEVHALVAAIEGTRQVLPGVLSSFATTVLVFGSLAFITGGGREVDVTPPTASGGFIADALKVMDAGAEVRFEARTADLVVAGGHR